MLPTFLWTSISLVASVIAVILAAVVCWLACQRSEWKRSTVILESLRFLIILLGVITLNQPEYEQEIKPTQQPTLVVLYDESGSMNTRDVLDPASPTSAPKTRSEAIEPMISEDVWAPLRENMEVVLEPFSKSQEGTDAGTDMNSPLAKLLDNHSNLRGVVVVGDGDWNTGDAPIEAATRLRMNNTPIYAIGVGSESRLPDIELVSLDAPSFGVKGKPIRIPFVVESSLPRDYDVTVTLTTSKGEKLSKAVRVPAKGRLHDAIVWRPKEVGEVELTMNVPQDSSEAITANNERKAPIDVRQETLKVLLVESFPRWEYRYLRNALERDPGVDVKCLLFHPTIGKLGGGRGYLKAFPTAADLQEFDVVFLGDVGAEAGQLTVEQCKELKQLVRNHAGGLVFMPGFRGKQATLLQTELDDLYPVVLDAAQPRGWGSRSPGQFELTEAGRRSLLTRLEEKPDDNARVWEGLPGFQWHAAVLRARAGTEVLATHKSDTTRFGRVPLIVTKTYGTGKILFMGTDGAWRWREGVEDKYHYRFWGQVARWMAYQRNMSKGQAIRLFYSPDRPQAGDTITLNANIMSGTGEPLQDGTVIVQVQSPSGQTDSVRLASGGEDSWGLFTGSFTPKEGGTYLLTTTCRENGARLETKLSVQSVVIEKLGLPARYDVLDEIAQVSRGRRASMDEIEAVVKEISELPEPEPVIRRFRLWSNPIWGGMIVGLLGVFWIGRKMAGTI